MKRIVVLVVLILLAHVHHDAAAEVRLTAAGSMDRMFPGRTFYGFDGAVVKSAKNEVESFQVVVSAVGGNATVTGASVSDFTGDGGATLPSGICRLYREEYVRVRRSTRYASCPPGLFPDPLVPFVNPGTGDPIEPRRQYRERWGQPIVTTGHEMYAVPFDVFRGGSQVLWVDVHVPADAPAGTYRASLTVTLDDGAAAGIPVELTVWDFALPDGPTHKNHLGSFRNIVRFFDVRRGTPEYDEIEMRYCEALAEHRINPPIPHRLLPEVNDDGSLTVDPSRDRELRDFIERLHVTDFEIPRAPYRDPAGADREKVRRYLRDYGAYLKRNGWFGRSYYYMHDEPNLAENYQLVRDYGALVHETVPGMKCLVVEQTYPQDPSWPDIDPAVDIWCPLWGFIHRESIADKISHGDEVWSYTALTQRAPRYHPDYDEMKDFHPPYWHIDQPLASYRAPLWINRRYGITGLLYWTTVTAVLDPWNNPAFSHFGRHFNGGGYLLYPGTPCGIDGAVACMRLKVLRDGMEDYEYFAILEKLGGKDAVEEIVASLAPAWHDFSLNPRDYALARERLAEEILRRQ